MKEGDFIVPKNAVWPFQDYSIYKVVGINELHYTAKWDRERKYPMCILMESHHGLRIWASPEDYFVLENTKPSDQWGKKPPESS